MDAAQTRMCVPVIVAGEESDATSVRLNMYHRELSYVSACMHSSIIIIIDSTQFL